MDKVYSLVNAIDQIKKKEENLILESNLSKKEKESEIEKLYQQYYFALEQGDPFHDLLPPIFTKSTLPETQTKRDEIFDFTNQSFNGKKNKNVT